MAAQGYPRRVSARCGWLPGRPVRRRRTAAAEADAGGGGGLLQAGPQSRAGLPVGTGLHDTEPGSGQGRRQVMDALQAGVRQSGRHGQLTQIGSVRRAEDALERAGPGEGRLLQQGENPAAVVVDHDQAQVGGGLTRAEDQPGRVVQERQVPQEGEGRSAACGLVGQGRADRRRGGAVDAAGAAAGQDTDPGAGRHVVVQVADGQAGRRPQQGAVRERGPEVPGQPRFAQGVGGVQDLVGGAAGRRIRPQPRFQPAGARPAPSAVPVGFRAVGQADSRGHVGGGARRIVPPAGLPGDDDVARRREFEQAGLLAGQAGAPRGDDDVRPVRAHEFGRAEQVLVGGQRVAAAAGAGGRFGQDGPARGLGQFAKRSGVVVAVTADDQAALDPRQLQRRCGPRPAERGPRCAAGAARQRFGPPSAVAVAAGHRPVRDERVAERQVQVDGTGRATRGARRETPGPAGQ